jgi:hypothetical protein
MSRPEFVFFLVEIFKIETFQSRLGCCQDFNACSKIRFQVHNHHLGPASRTPEDNCSNALVGHRQLADFGRTVRLRFPSARKDFSHKCYKVMPIEKAIIFIHCMIIAYVEESQIFFSVLPLNTQ